MTNCWCVMLGRVIVCAEQTVRGWGWCEPGSWSSRPGLRGSYRAGRRRWHPLSVWHTAEDIAIVILFIVSHPNQSLLLHYMKLYYYKPKCINKPNTIYVKQLPIKASKSRLLIGSEVRYFPHSIYWKGPQRRCSPTNVTKAC